MQRNAIWVAFVCIVLGFSIWFVVKAGYDLTRYYSYNTEIPLSAEQWEVKEQGANRYAVFVAYHYTFEEKEYHGEAQWGKSFPNPWAANRAIEKGKEAELGVWINPKAPEKGVLQRKFPYKGALSAVVLIGLVIYFICLGLYAGVKHEQRRP